MHSSGSRWVWLVVRVLASVLAVMLLVNNLRSLPKELKVATVVAIAVIALSIFDLMGRSAYSLFMRLSLITVFVVIEVAALITLRFRRAA